METCPGEKKEGKPERNLLNEQTRRETVEAIATLEGPRWLSEQQQMELRLEQDAVVGPREIEGIAHNTLPGLFSWLREQQLAQEKDPEADHGKQYVLYGYGGFNRWHINADGSVGFSESHAQAGHTERARELGFEIDS